MTIKFKNLTNRRVTLRCTSGRISVCIEDAPSTPGEKVEISEPEAGLKVVKVPPGCTADCGDEA